MRSYSQNVHSMMMLLMVDSEFQYLNLSSQAFATNTVTNIRQCQMMCVIQEQCRTINFHESTNQCELFADTPGNGGMISTRFGSKAMVVIDGTRIPAG
ncbi:unnamed protein product [Rotaria sp. Silwood1]|nr:unnamed protein product [Rotaria sp. Silwood1]